MCRKDHSILSYFTALVFFMGISGFSISFRHHVVKKDDTPNASWISECKEKPERKTKQLNSSKHHGIDYSMASRVLVAESVHALISVSRLQR